MNIQLATPAARQRREPAWDVALLYPPQGEWSEADYLSLSTNRQVEYSHGFIEVLEMPTARHQMILAFLYRLLHAFVSSRNLGAVLFAAFPVRLWEGKFREPDILFMSAANAARMHDEYWEGADLVIEIVSGNRQHDLIHKRREYAQAGIPEYWIVDPQSETVIVLELRGDGYAEHGVFHPGDIATSPTLGGLRVPVADALRAGASIG
jgi:Uma2 family endonuclease